MKRFFFTNPLFELFVLIYFLFLLFAFWSILLFFSDTSRNVALLIVVMIVIIEAILFYFLVFDRKIYIDHTGVMYKSLRKNLFLKWEDIKEIGFVERGLGYKFVCFSTKENETGRKILSFSEQNIYMRNRVGLIRFIKHYWNKEITTLDQREYQKYNP